MAGPPTVALARVTIKASERWIDAALPADVPVAELLPYVLRHAGEDAADAGERHAGWLLRRPTGERIDPHRTFAAQRVRDGELLHLTPGDVEWPELEYEDVVETIASGARRYGRGWGRAATRRCGLVLATAGLLAGVLLVPLFRPPWTVPGVVLLGVGAALLAAGVMAARAIPDARAGMVFAGCGLPYGFLGGLLLTTPAHAGLTALGAPQLLLGGAVLVGFGVAGYAGVPVLGRFPVAAMTAGLLAVLGALVAGPLPVDAAAAVVVTAGIGLLPGYPLLAVRIGRVPMPALPQRSADLFTDDPPPATPDVFQAAARTVEVLTGLLTGLAVAAVAAVGFLVVAGGAAHQLLTGAVAVALLLRCRLFTVPRQRIPLLAAGVGAVAALLGLRAVGTAGNGDLVLVLLVAVAAGLVAALAGLAYSRRTPSPYLGRLGDILDVVAILALVPLTAYLAGFFGYVQSLLAGLG